MNRSLVIILGALALGSALFSGSYFISHQASVLCCSQPSDAFCWLRMEFHLNDADMARMRQLQEGYMPQCANMCALIVAKKAEIKAMLDAGTNSTEDIGKTLAELGLLRAQCQEQMLRYFIAASKIMPAEQRSQYLAEMERITLGVQDPMERSMSENHEPGNH